MKKIVFILALTVFANLIFAKKIKFAVDMATHTINPNGIHLMSDFQAYLGLPLGDWQPNTLQLNQEGASTIYSVILNLPAFAKYEFKFVNGTFGYEAEFVPNESRVEPFAFNDNRWIYLDSLKNDTTFVGAVVFGGNAPAGKSLIRFMVDMTNEASVSANGVHVGGTFQSSTWNAKNDILYSFTPKVYEVIAYAVAGNYEFKYYNGNTAGSVETVTGTCINGSGNRTHTVTKDSILPTICYKSCVNCTLAGIEEMNGQMAGVKLYPNPATTSSTIEFKAKDVDYFVSVSDLAGRVLQTYSSNNGESIVVQKDNLPDGLYFVNITDSRNAKASSKLIIQ